MKRSLLVLALLGFVLVSCAVAESAPPTGLPTVQPATIQASLTPTITSTPGPTLTPTPTPLFQDKSKNYFATGTAFVSGLRSLPNSFDQPENWPTGTFKSADGQVVRSIQDKTYHWSVTAKNALFDSVDLKGSELPARFRVRVDGEVSKSGSLAPGVVGLKFRSDPVHGTFYLFAVNEFSQTFSVSAHLSTGWVTILSETGIPIAPIDLGNFMEIAADGPRYLLFISGRYIGAFEDDRLKSGGAGLAVELGAGQSADFDFYTFSLFR